MRISRLLLLIFSVLILGLGALFGSLLLLSKTQEEIAASEYRRFASFKLADELRQSSDDLTLMARLYVTTGEQRFADYFREILEIRSGERPRPQDYDLVYWDLVGKDGQRPRPDGTAMSLEDLMFEQGFSLLEFSKLSEAKENSDDLVRLEDIAMNAVRGQFEDGQGGFTRAGAPDLELAQRIMFGENYLEAKASIMEPINEFFVLLDERTKQEVSVLRSRGNQLMVVSLLISVTVFGLSIASIIVLSKKVLWPLSLISAATHHVGQGNYDHHIKHRSKDEVGQLVKAFNAMVDETRSSVSELHQTNDTLQEHKRELEREKKKSEDLLLNVLPSVIAQRLRDGETTIADEFPEVSVMFADLVNFTELAEELGPHELVRLLNDIFALFDRRLEEWGLEKIKTIGDCYMVVAGIPEPVADHAHRIGEFALAVREDFSRFVAARGLDIKIRVGVHSGTAIAGVVGTKRFAYDLWGDVVNVASRIESTGVAGKIHVSEAFMVRLADTFVFELHGDIDVKGKGIMRTYFLEGRRYDLSATTE